MKDPSLRPEISIVIVAFEAGEDVRAQLTHLSPLPESWEVVVVENGVRELTSTPEWTSSPRVRIHQTERNLGYAGGANLGATLSTGEILLFLNPDVRISLQAVRILASALRAAPGVAGPATWVDALKTLEFGGSINHLGMPTGLKGAAPPLYVGGHALAINRFVYEVIGGFDERYFLFVEDVELCWRVLLAGFEVSAVRGASAWHRGGGSAVGGYAGRDRLYVTSVMRVALRERNTIAMFISCAPAWWLPIILPCCILRSLCIAGAAVVLGRPALGTELVRGLLWNCVQVPQSMRRRKSLTTIRAQRQVASRRLVRSALLFRTLVKHGLPKIEQSDCGAIRE
jgi:GT2 family glycosyltransferase